MAYRPLAVGETLRAGDEGYFDAHGCWLLTRRVGKQVKHGQSYRRKEEQPGTAPQTETGPATESGQNTTNPMTLIKVWFTQKPSALEAQAGEVEKLVLPPVEVLAEDKPQAIAIVTFANHDKLAAANLARCSVIATSMQ